MRLLFLVALLSIPASRATAGGCPDFPRLRSFHAGEFPRGIVHADFNGDGRIDVAVTSEREGRINVLLGLGGGEFGWPVTVYWDDTLALPLLVAADFNGDSHEDLAFVRRFGSRVIVLLGGGDGTFLTPTETSTGDFTSALSIAAGDLNGDGRADLVVTAQDKVAILLAQQTGSFASALNYKSGEFSSAAAIGDVNGDRKPDLAIAMQYAATVSILLGDGAGGFTPSRDLATVEQPTAVGLVDLEGDSKLDLVVTSYWKSNDVWVHRGDGEGLFPFGVAHLAGRGVNSLTFGDFNGDGRPDVATANLLSRTVSVFLSDPATGLLPAHHYDTPSPFAVTAGDANGDGLTDLLLTSGEALLVADGRGDGTIAAAESYLVGPQPFDLAVEDFDGDGELDLAVPSSILNDVSIFRGRGDGSFVVPTEHYASGSRPIDIAAGDLNRDGWVDLVVSHKLTPQQSSVAIMLNENGNRMVVAGHYVTGEAPGRAAIGDFNGDQNPDIVVTDYSTSEIVILEGDGSGAFRITRRYSTGDGPSKVVASDLNGDGELDLLVSNWRSGFLSVFVGVGDGRFNKGVVIKTTESPFSIAVADFDEDGVKDVALSGAGGASILIGRGDATFEVGATFRPRWRYASVAVADFNGDGHADLAVTSDIESFISFFLGKGDGTFATGAEIPAADKAFSIVTADFSNDGTADLAYIQVEAGRVAVMLNDGSCEVPRRRRSVRP